MEFPMFCFFLCPFRICNTYNDQAVFVDEEHQRAKGKTFTSWKSRSVDARSKLKIATDAKPWSGRTGVLLSGLPQTARVADCVDICYQQAVVQKKSTDPAIVAKDLWCNPSQNIGFSCKAHLGAPGTFCRSSTWYSYEHDATMSGQTQLQLLGWHADCAPMDSFSEGETRSLSGDGFSIPIACVVSTSMWLNPHGPWWKRRVEK